MSSTSTDDVLAPEQAEAFRLQVREFLEQNASGIGRRSETSLMIGKKYQAALRRRVLLDWYTPRNMAERD